MTDNEIYYLTDSEGVLIPGEIYDNEEDAIDARARLLASHSDGDQVTVETETELIETIREEIKEAEEELQEISEQDLSPEEQQQVERLQNRLENQKNKQEQLEEVKSFSE